MTPKITLDNFQLMGEGTTYWLENFDVEKIGGKNVLKNSYNYTKRYDNDDTYGTDFTNLTTIQAFSHFIELNGDKNLVAFNGQHIFMFPVLVQNNAKGEIHSRTISGSSTNQVIGCNYSDLVTTKEGNLLYTSANHLGIGVYGKCKTGSGTTKIVDSAGRNFTTLGVLNTGSGATAPAKYVYNLNNKERYEVTSITTTNATNDTLNFSAGTSNDADNEYIVFVDNGWTGAANFKFNSSTSRDGQFKGQDGANSWKRQIELFGDDYFILNGNYLATLNIDMTTWAYDAKQLPYSTQATSVSVNNGQMLVGGDYFDNGKLLLWDGYTSGWNSIMDIDLPPVAIVPYNNGWLYTDSLNIYFTNGYERQFISKLPDSNSFYSYTAFNFNSLLINEDKIYIYNGRYSYNRSKCGIYVYSLTEDGWTFIPQIDKNSKYEYDSSSLTALYGFIDNNRTYILYSNYDSISYITRDSKSARQSIATLYIKLPQKMRLNKIELNIDQKLNAEMPDITSSFSNNIYLSIGQGRRPLWTYIQASSASTASSIVNSLGDVYPAKVGQKLTIVDANTSDAIGGEFSWITGITNAGTNTETWAISPSLSADITDTVNILVQDVYLQGTRVIAFDSDINFNETLQWDVKDFFSDKLFIDIIVNSDNTMTPLQINSVNIY